MADKKSEIIESVESVELADSVETTPEEKKSEKQIGPESDEKTEKEEKVLYYCSGCTTNIPNDRARILCHKCLNYHLCANCFVIKQYTKPHVHSHPTMVFKQSGFMVPGAPGFPLKLAPPALPPRPKPTVAAQQQQVEIPTADWGLLWNLMKAPLQKKNQKPKEEITGKGFEGIEVKDVTNGPVRALPDS
jgi:hypothetical protein